MAVCCASRDLELCELGLRSKAFGAVHSGAILYTLGQLPVLCNSYPTSVFVFVMDIVATSRPSPCAPPPSILRQDGAGCNAAASAGRKQDTMR